MFDLKEKEPKTLTTIAVDKDTKEFLTILARKGQKSIFIRQLIINSKLFKQFLKEKKDGGK